MKQIKTIRQMLNMGTEVDCTFTLGNGTAITHGGACAGKNNDGAVRFQMYLEADKVTDWHGKRFVPLHYKGRKYRSNMGDMRQSVYVRLLDSKNAPVLFYGTSYGNSQLVRFRQIKTA